MDEHTRRDESIDRLLTQAFDEHAPTSPAGHHLDGEVAAAWVERALDPQAARAVEAHLADCARCQSLTAALVRTMPDPAPARAWWRAWQVRWLLPMAAAAAVAVWVALPGREGTAPAPAGQLQARLEIPANVPGAPASVPEGSAPEATRGTPSARASRPAAVAPTTNAKRTARVDERTAAAEGSPAQPSADKAEADRARNAGAAPPAPEPERFQDAAAQQEARASAPAAPASLAAEAPSRQGRALGAVASADIVAGSGTHRWRILNGQTVEYSAGGDAGWRSAAVPDATGLTAGSAPAGTVCWIVGRGGVVLLTIDGLRFTRRTAPASDDLVEVRAADARSAVVVTAGGRAFRTSDAGASWAPAAP